MIQNTRGLTNYLFSKFKNLPMQPKELWNEITNYEDEEEEKTINIEEQLKKIEENIINKKIDPETAYLMRNIIIGYNWESKEYKEWERKKNE